MHKIIVFIGCALFTLTASLAAADDAPQKISLSQVPPKVLAAAGEAERGVTWIQVLYKAGNSPTYVLQGKIVTRPYREQLTFDGDIDITPELSEKVEIAVSADGTLSYVVKSLPLTFVPAEVTRALQTKCTTSPSVAHEVRLSAKATPKGYVFWIDERGLLQYVVSADGKHVEKL